MNLLRILILLLWVPIGSAWADTGVPLFPGEGDAVLEVRHGDAVWRLAPQEDGEWLMSVADGPARRANTDAARRLLSQFRSLATWRDMGRHGVVREGAFADPIEISLGWQNVVLGGDSRVPGLIYVRLSDGSVHLMPSMRVLAGNNRPPLDLTRPPRGLVERRLFPEGIGEVDDIHLDGAGLVLHVARKFGVWRVTVPEPAAADGPVIDDWLIWLAALKGDPDAVPMDSDALSVVLSSTDADVRRIALSAGGHLSIDGEIWRTDGAMTLPSRFAWSAKQVLQIDPQPLTGLTLQHGDKTLRFIRDEKGDWRGRVNGTLYRKWGKGLLALLNPLPAEGLFDGDLNRLGEPSLELGIWQGQTVQTTIELWQGNNGEWWARGGDSVFVYRVKKALPRHLLRLFP